MKHVYNTGKVQIGLAYERPQHFEQSLDMERLQKGLLRSRKSTTAKSTWFIAIVTIATSVAIFATM
jgi:hypothetical protein